jgi:hypothetical protein
MARTVAIPAFLVAVTVGAAVAVSSAGETNETARNGATAAKPLRWEAHDLFIETNATDGDAGLQMNLDAEHWKRFELRDPKGRLLADVHARSRLRGVGLSELFFEAAEPPFSKFPFSRFKKRFPEGKYRFSGETVNGRELVGSDRLSHLVPDGPKVTFPTKGAQVDRNDFHVSWEAVTHPAGVEIVSYEVIVSQGNRELDMHLPPGVTSVSIPPEFLKPGSEGGGEVLAREKSGNQTITEIPSYTVK